MHGRHAHWPSGAIAMSTSVMVIFHTLAQSLVGPGSLRMARRGKGRIYRRLILSGSSVGTTHPCIY